MPRVERGSEVKYYIDKGNIPVGVVVISAIVTSIDKENMLVMPTEDIDPSNVVGKKVRYLDKDEKAWPGVVIGISDAMLVIKFDAIPSGLGQGQIVDILEEGEDVNYKEEDS